MMGSALLHLHYYVTIFFLSIVLISRASLVTANFKGIDLQKPVIDVTPSRLYGLSPSEGSKDVLLCERVKVSGHSRSKLGSYAKSFRVTLAPSVVIPEKLHSKIQVCFHRNVSLELCHCERDEWKAVQKGVWNFAMSPYEERYVDVKYISDISGSVTVSVDEVSQQWRLFCLALGFVVLLLAPVVSNWVPFYYSSSMVIGVFLVVIIILFQGMKLLPTGRKNILYLSLYGSMIGTGTFILHHISMLANSILVNFGLNEEMHNPVFVLVVVGIVLAGAALGYWMVRKFVILKDGSVDVGIAQFVKWSMRIVATALIFQSTADTPLAVATLVSSYIVCSLINKLMSPRTNHQPYSRSGNPWFGQNNQYSPKPNRAEFLSRSATPNARGKIWSSPRNSSGWSNSPVKGLVSPLARPGTMDHQDYYSTFHKTMTQKNFTKKQWKDFTKESTRQAMSEWASSPEVTNWLMENADRIQLLPTDSSSEDLVGSESDSTDENFIGSSRGFGLFNW